MSPPPRPLDQILFCWKEQTLTGSSGVGPAASSLRSKTEIAQWEQRLLAADWAAAAVTSGAPPALVYLRFNGQAVVMRKEAVTDPQGRGGSPLAHAVIGPASVLSAQVALGLHDWDGWISQASVPASLGGVDAADVQTAAEDGYRALRDGVRELNQHLLAALLATVLSDPSGRFSVYPPDNPGFGLPAGSPVLAAKLMCGLLDVLGEVGDQPLTFSTGEAEEPPTASRPRLVFLHRAKTFSTRGRTGHHVTMGQPAWRAREANQEDEQRLWAFGKSLVGAYAQMGPGVIDRLRPDQPICTLGDAIAWSGRAQLTPGILNDPGYVLLVAIGESQLDDDTIAALWKKPEFHKAIPALRPEVFEQLPRAWAPGQQAPAANPAIAGEIRREAAWRYIDSGEAPDRNIAVALGVQPGEWIDQLRRCRQARGLAGLRTAAPLAAPLLPPDADGEFARLLAELPPADILSFAHAWVVERPTLSLVLLEVVADGPALTGAQRAACRDRLEELHYLVSTLERCHPQSPRGAAYLFSRLLDKIFDADLAKPPAVEWLAGRIAGTRSAPLLWALADRVPEGHRGYVLSAAANAWFEDNGLDRLSAAMAPAAPAAAPAAPPRAAEPRPREPVAPVPEPPAAQPGGRPILTAAILFMGVLAVIALILLALGRL